MFCVCKLSLNGRLLVLPFQRIIDKDLLDNPNVEGKLVKRGPKFYYGTVLRMFMNRNKADEHVDKINSEVDQDIMHITSPEKNSQIPNHYREPDMEELFHDIKAIKNSLEIIEADQVEIKKSISELKSAVYEDGFEMVNRKKNSFLPHEIVESSLMPDTEFEANNEDCNEQELDNSQSLGMELNWDNIELPNGSEELSNISTNGIGFTPPVQNGGQYHSILSEPNGSDGTNNTRNDHITLELPPASFRAHITDDELVEAIQLAASAPTYSKAIRRLMDTIVPVKVEPGPLRNELVSYLARFVKNHFNSDLGETPIRCIVREKFKDRVKSLKLSNKLKALEAASLVKFDEEEQQLMMPEKKIKLEQEFPL